MSEPMTLSTQLRSLDRNDVAALARFVNDPALLEALEAAEKLPRTWDRKLVTPEMELFYIYTLAGRSWVNPAQPSTDPRFCYSSREAAESALAAQTAGKKE